MGFYEGQCSFDCIVVVEFLSYALLLILRQHTLPEIVLSIVLTVIGIVIYYTSGEWGALFHIVDMFGIKGFKV